MTATGTQTPIAILAPVEREDELPPLGGVLVVSGEVLLVDVELELPPGGEHVYAPWMALSSFSSSNVGQSPNSD